MTSSAAAKSYYRLSDYHAASPGEWLGKGAEILGLTGNTSPEQFDSLADNLDPRTGDYLTAGGDRENRRVGLDMTFNATKSVSIAREMAGPDNEGDPRIEEAHREAVAYTVGLVEKDMQARVRVGGANENRTTGNIVAYRVTHRDTRVSAEDQRPDPHLHCHVFIFNATYDPVEKKWKAAEIGEMKHDAPYFEAAYHNRLAHNLKELGYGIRKKDKAFEIAGISDDLVKKFSRRRQYIKAVAEKLGITSPEGMSKLGATTRLGKAKELADDLNAYYVSRLTEKERGDLQNLEGKPSYESNDRDAMRFAIGHEFERKSVIEERKLYETAIRHGIGSVTPEGIEKEAHRQGVLWNGKQVTTRDVLEEEQRIIEFAREGRGVFRPLGKAVRTGFEPAVPVDAAIARPRTPLQIGLSTPSDALNHSATARYAKDATLSSEQQAVSTRGLQSASSSLPNEWSWLANLSPEQTALVHHVWNSPDQVILIRGAAGTGKTTAMKTAIAGINAPVAVLAPSADASRTVLRNEGFKDADTVAAFLGDAKWQNRVKDGVIWVDEAGMLNIRDLARLTDVAKEQNARLILAGDPKQHRSVGRDGNMFTVLQQLAGLPVAQLTDIKRQKGKYKEAVSQIEKGDFLKAHDMLNELCYIRSTPVFDHNKPLVDDYLATLNAGKSVLVVAPAHKEGDEITAEIRKRLKEDGRLKGDEKEFGVLRARNLTESQRGSALDEGDVAVFFRSAGRFKAGDRVEITGENRDALVAAASKFAVYRHDSIHLVVGDVIRATAHVKDVANKRIDNGTSLTVTGFSEKGIEVRTAKGQNRVLPDTVGHITHGYVSTSHASQGKTVDVVLGAYGLESKPAVSASAFYVTASRGRERFTLYTNMSPTSLREAIQRQDRRKSATELIGPPKRKPFIQRLRDLTRRLRERLESVTHQITQPEYAYGR